MERASFEKDAYTKVDVFINVAWRVVASSNLRAAVIQEAERIQIVLGGTASCNGRKS
ncbi:hypothetical protein [Brevibacillus invocatus]|uniref:hypothetical protein n=1 Tax=Brevibacillus invocatus TaxID=173959 RepID=UPI002041D08F|nr:hypothetical protein [Brevibacillus invocatus]MCM3431708.1 hypothetical protein [Brevibacillus invocatus]